MSVCVKGILKILENGIMSLYFHFNIHTVMLIVLIKLNPVTSATVRITALKYFITINECEKCLFSLFCL